MSQGLPVTVEVFDRPSGNACAQLGWGPSWSPEEIVSIIAQELKSRFGSAAQIIYRDLSDTNVAKSHVKAAEEIEVKGLFFPVTFINGSPLNDGSVSYPLILKTVTGMLNNLSDW